MSIQRQVAFWCATFLFLILVLVVLRGVMLPFVAGLVLAYLLDPLADRFEALGVGRLTATVIILGVFILVFILALMLIVPVLGNQLAAFIGKLPDTVSRLQQLAAEQGGPFLKKIGGASALPEMQKSIGEFATQAAGWLVSVLQSLWSSGQAIISIFSLMVVTPVVAFYLLVDWDRMVATVDGWVPLRHRDTVRTLAKEMDRAIAGFFRGQALVCLVLGTFYAVSLTLTGLNFGVLIGIGSGLLTFIPYVGSLTGFVVSIAVAIVQFWPDWTMIAAVAAIYLFGQFIEGNVLSPKLVGDAVGLHPVWLMFALLAFGSLFGFVGVLLAVPLAAAGGVLVRFALRQYLASPLYDEANRLPAPASPPAAPANPAVLALRRPAEDE